MTDRPIHILTMKWGDAYSADDVNKLCRGVARHLSLSHRFICFTDDSKGLDDTVEAYPLPEVKLPKGRVDTRWRKLGLFSQDLFGLAGTALFLDLDIVVVDDLDPFFHEVTGVTMIRDRTLFRSKPLRKLRPRRDAFLRSVGNSSVFLFVIGAHSYVLDNYVADPLAAMTKYAISQQFQSAQLAEREKLTYWPDGWCVSFKNHCVPRHLSSFFADPVLPKGARVVVFAGEPKMNDALNGRGDTWYRRIGNVDWLQNAWEC